MNRVGISLFASLLPLLLFLLLHWFNVQAFLGTSTSSTKGSLPRRLFQTRRFSVNETLHGGGKNDASARQRRPLVQRPLRRPATPVAVERREQRQGAIQRSEMASHDPSLLSHVRWEDLLLQNGERDALSPASWRAITEGGGFQRLTHIQAQTWSPALAGRSLVARAPTGTGKTLAYLVPAVERLRRMEATVFRPGRTMGLLILAPTRELVVQIAQQASTLVTFYSPTWTVQAFYGGGSIQKDRAVLYHRPLPTILVATPGRLYDLLREPCRLSGNRMLTDVMSQCPIVVLDEADRLLQGFSWEMNKLWSYLPRVEKRQTMLFSATIPAKLKASLVSGDRANVIPSDFVTIDCEVPGEEEETNPPRVEQLCVPLDDMKQYVSRLYSLVHAVMTDPNRPKYKVLIFLPTAKLVNFFAHVFATSSLPVLAIHSRMSQGSRQKASQRFHQSTARCVMLSSDVSARGLDYPDVDLVVQYGAPFSDDLYLHRLGRTGRAGQVGCGLLVLLPFENPSRWKHLKMPQDPLAYWNTQEEEVATKVLAVQNYVRGGHAVLLPIAEAAYLSFVAHYLEYGGEKRNRTCVMDAAAQLAESFGLASIPAIEK